MCLPEVLRHAIRQGKTERYSEQDSYETDKLNAHVEAQLLLTIILAVQFRNAARQERDSVSLQLEWGRFSVGFKEQQQLAYLQQRFGFEPLRTALEAMGLEYDDSYNAENAPTQHIYDRRVPPKEMRRYATVYLPTI